MTTFEITFSANFFLHIIKILRIYGPVLYPYLVTNWKLIWNSLGNIIGACLNLIYDTQFLINFFY